VCLLPLARGLGSVLLVLPTGTAMLLLLLLLLPLLVT
jgi:hypothetical protein